MSADAKQRMIRRVAAEIRAGMTVNLGVGLPTRVIDHVNRDQYVCLHSENGIAGVGPGVAYDSADRNLIDAGGAYVSTHPGIAFFDSAVSFALVRGGPGADMHVTRAIVPKMVKCFQLRSNFITAPFV